MSEGRRKGGAGERIAHSAGGVPPCPFPSPRALFPTPPPCQPRASPLPLLTKVLAEHGAPRLLHRVGAPHDALKLHHGRVQGEPAARVHLDGDDAAVRGGQSGGVVDDVGDLGKGGGGGIGGQAGLGALLTLHTRGRDLPPRPGRGGVQGAGGTAADRARSRARCSKKKRARCVAPPPLSHPPHEQHFAAHQTGQHGRVDAGGGGGDVHRERRRVLKGAKKKERMGGEWGRSVFRRPFTLPPPFSPIGARKRTHSLTHTHAQASQWRAPRPTSTSRCSRGWTRRWRR